VKYKSRNFNKEVDCRFYEFRKLRYNENGVMEVAGFLDPFSDPIDIDIGIWSPPIGERSKGFRIPAQTACFILTHVGGELCRLIEKEKVYMETYRKPDKPIIWKRLIDKVMEVCDACATTLFNVHFICGVCGISLCVDCASEAVDGEFKVSCSIPYHDRHKVEDLLLTQIIVGDCMVKLQRMLHDTCHFWAVEHDCEFMKDKPEYDKATENLARNLRLELATGKSVVGRELTQKNASTISTTISSPTTIDRKSSRCGITTLTERRTSTAFPGRCHKPLPRFSSPTCRIAGCARTNCFVCLTRFTRRMKRSSTSSGSAVSQC
jgi:hypothetical protein